MIAAAAGAVLAAQPTPRLPDGKTDFGGKGVWAPIWVLDWSAPQSFRFVHGLRSCA